MIELPKGLSQDLSKFVKKVLSYKPKSRPSRRKKEPTVKEMNQKFKYDKKTSEIKECD